MLFRSAIARLFRHPTGTHGITVSRMPGGLDAAATRAGNRVFLHIVNTEYRRTVEARFAVAGGTVTGGRVFQIAPDDLRTAALAGQPDVFQPVASSLPPDLRWRFPPGAVAAVELETT